MKLTRTRPRGRIPGWSFVAVTLAIVVACAPAGPQSAPQAAPAKTFRVGISQFFSHPVIDDYREGFKEGMAKGGLVEGQNVTYDVQNAQFNMDTLRAIAQKFQADKVDMVFTMTTPATLATLNVVSDIPVVFGLATDAKASGILKDTAHPDRNATGVESWWPADKHLDAMRKVLPNAKRLGVPYNSGETNSRVQMDNYKQAAGPFGFEFVEANVTSTNDVQAAVQSLVGRSDAILIIGDNTVQGALGAVLKVGFENKLPVLSTDPENAKDGVLTGWGILQKDTGAQAGELAARVLKGAKIADTPVEKPRKYWFTINTAAAQRLGVAVPADALKQADQTYDTLTLQ
jgi:putative ABC transport system substrate-binding protein